MITYLEWLGLIFLTILLAGALILLGYAIVSSIKEIKRPNERKIWDGYHESPTTKGQE